METRGACVDVKGIAPYCNDRSVMEGIASHSNDYTDGAGPPPYSCTDPCWKLTYVDFTPKCMVEGGIVTSAKYETFE